ncbi:hypothetical protein D1F64_14930 [Breoghania sp. L-A4]|nr:hypothetical protein D1F64_14930 [Breoghania sp. L-A4]
MNFRALSTLTAVVMIGFGGAALAVDDPIKARQELMKGIGDSMKALGQMAKGEIEYDAAKATAAVETIHTNIQTFPNHFPKAPTRARPKPARKSGRTWTASRPSPTISRWLPRRRFRSSVRALTPCAARSDRSAKTVRSAMRAIA